VEVYLGMEQ